MYQPSTISHQQTMNDKTKTAKTVEFQKEKDTKNTVKFAEVQTQGQAPVIGALYVQKWFAGDSSRLKVTIEVQ